MVQDASLANLQPGNRKGSKNKITKAIALKLVEYMDEGFASFTDEIAQLAPRDRVAAKLKLLQLVLPKQHEVEVEAIDTTRKWEIRRAVAPQPAAEPEVVEDAVVVEEVPEGDPHQLSLDFVPAPKHEVPPVGKTKPVLTLRRAPKA